MKKYIKNVKILNILKINYWGKYGKINKKDIILNILNI